MSSQRYETQIQNLGNVVLSNTHKDPSIQLDEMQLTAKGSQGYRTVLGTHGVTTGTYMYQFRFNFQTQTSAFRCGFQPISAELGAPVGFDTSSYGIRSIDLSTVNGRKRENPHPDVQLAPNDVITCLIHLPLIQPPFDLPEETEMCFTKGSYASTVGRKAVENDDSEEQNFLESDSTPLVIHEGAFVRFYVNERQVQQLDTVYYNRYYPAVSLYQFCAVTCNFGVQNVRLPNYPPEWYQLPFCLANSSQTYALLGQNALAVGPEEVPMASKEKPCIAFAEFLKSQQNSEKTCGSVDIEIDPDSFAFLEAIQAGAPGPVQGFSALYLARARRDQQVLAQEVAAGQYTVDLHYEIARFYGDGRLRMKKMKK
ncbi:hypothetical protein SS50377_27225 [Spironucleus salmonicida]|uniref:SPRY domain-containing protein n=1 Tax=Spironucleus salmonicida TaxID=348837 RepID=V6LWD0_9EUKA|nr:hypothetical protein SS50377_27225 [Spironucleus salmonicida]|eukprot:EST48937.1 hypothetical protein SS50377_10780 [Spironucleus salmonicida]